METLTVILTQNTAPSGKPMLIDFHGCTSYSVHLKHHCIPATSAAKERAFSAAEYIVSDRRNTLDDDIVEKCSIAKCNSDNFA